MAEARFGGLSAFERLSNHLVYAQQYRLRNRDCCNPDQPHRALEMRYSAELYVASPRPYSGAKRIHLPAARSHGDGHKLSTVCFGQRKINLGTVFAGQNVGVKQVDERIWLVTFRQHHFGGFRR